MTRQREREGRSWTVVGLRPDTALMSFDDRTADEQADAHATTLRGVERVEQGLPVLGGNAGTGIADRQAHAIVPLWFGRDPDLPRAIVHGGHRVCGVAQQVQDDLLKLDAISGDHGKIVRQLYPHGDAMSLKIVGREREDLPGRLVEIERLEREVPFAEQGPQAGDDICGAVAVATRPACRLAGPLDSRRA